MDTETPPLFQRLPAEIFRPLSAGNNRRYWAVLSRLMREIWGDGGRSPGEEAPKNVVVRAIESHLVADDPWENEMETPVAIRANGVYGILRESGWLTQRRRGVVDTVTVRPVIAQFFTTLSDFATQKPKFIGSEVRSIFLNLRAVSTGEAGGDAYAQAARQAKECMAYLANTGLKIHELMDELVAKSSAREFVKGYFEEYVEKVFIADYSEIRTKDHPLQHRSAIVTTTIQFQHDDTRREALITWYQEKQTRGDRLRAEAQYELDTYQLLRLRDVEDHLRRLDEEIRVANQRAMAFIEYKLRAPRNFDKLIAQAVSAANVIGEGHIALPTVSGHSPASGYGLAKPRLWAREQTVIRLDRREPTIEELAMEMLRKSMAEHRMVTAVRLAEYVARNLDGKTAISSDELTIESIADLCCYQRLLLIASRQDCPTNMRRSDPHLQLLRRLRVSFVLDQMTRNEYLEHKQFMIRVEAA